MACICALDLGITDWIVSELKKSDILPRHFPHAAPDRPWELSDIIEVADLFGASPIEIIQYAEKAMPQSRDIRLRLSLLKNIAQARVKPFRSELSGSIVNLFLRVTPKRIIAGPEKLYEKVFGHTMSDPSVIYVNPLEREFILSSVAAGSQHYFPDVLHRTKRHGLVRTDMHIRPAAAGTFSVLATVKI